MLLPTGHVIDGRFRVDGPIGRGGFGAVYRATDLAMERPVAVKVLLPQAFMHPGGLDRFRREAELTQRLGHPNTVRLYAYGEVEGGAPYTVWELLEGRPLDAILRETPRMPLARVIRIGTQALKALAEAHDAGIVHRDIKPANIMVCQYAGEADFVKVLDFGIAAAAEADAQLTQTGQSMGTPSYMSPEQVDGAKNVDGRSDLYALGLVLAEAIAGRVVMQGPSAMRICLEQMSEQPVPLPPEVAGCRIGPVIVRACRKRAAERYASAGEMLVDLQRHASGQAYGSLAPTPLAVVQPSYAPSKPAPTSRTLWVMVVGLLVALAVVGGYALSLRSDVEAARSKPTRVPPALEDFAVKGMSAQAIVDALEERGFAITLPVQVQSTAVHTGHNYVFAHVDGDGKGSLMFHTYRKARAAETAAAQPATAMAWRRDGARLVGISLDGDRKRGEALLDDLMNE